MMDLSFSSALRSTVALLGTLLVGGMLATAAHGQVAQSSALFLRIEPDSRASGMGNAGVATADNANAMFWNPAGLGFQEGTQAGITHANWLPEFNANLFYEYLVGTYHVDGIGTFGGNVQYLNLGETEIRDAQGNQLGVSNSYQLAVATSYGTRVSERLSVGTSLRFIYSKLASGTREGTGEGNASTLATDISALYRSAPFALGGSEATFSAGLNVANLGGTLNFNSNSPSRDPIPASLRFGPALTIDFDEFNSLTFATDFNKSLVSVDRETRVQGGDTTQVQIGNNGFEALFDSWGSARGQVGPDGEAASLSLAQQFTVGTGVEYWYDDLFALRTGYYYEHPDNGDRQFLTFGAGLRYNIVGVDVSYLYTSDDSSPLANTLRFSLLFNFQ
ncbi:type IX secretion system outer membrane channel protein PorV [Salinibacter ruber]|uniref:type IX secretion system outer membrane channel protein PorV n=1 Tax=Salinibacter ruber TaxID=146919 RepID=UPI0024511A11|nr:long-subunit fatty acid transport protein [Salinibacter ruber]MCS3676002.1 long-subunit fatty acid transport protein [Salinibacter ruber]